MMTQSTSFPHFRTSWPLGSAVSRTSSFETKGACRRHPNLGGSRGIDMMEGRVVDLFVCTATTRFNAFSL